MRGHRHDAQSSAERPRPDVNQRGKPVEAEPDEMQACEGEPVGPQACYGTRSSIDGGVIGNRVIEGTRDGRWQVYDPLEPTRRGYT